MLEETPIREYEQAVYIYWFGSSLPTIKIGHSNDPDKRLIQLGNDTGVPDHLASFAAIVWVDRKREKVEALAHQLAADYRRTGEWFELSPSAALTYIIEAARQLGVRFEIEDRAGVYCQPPENYQQAVKLLKTASAKVFQLKANLADIQNNIDDLEDDVDIAERNRLYEQFKHSKSALEFSIIEKNRAEKFHDEKFKTYRLTPEYQQEQLRESYRQKKIEEERLINEQKFNEKAIAFWKKKWENEK
jgi:hypothetical protein